jgi:hypothetical protein
MVVEEQRVGAAAVVAAAVALVAAAVMEAGADAVSGSPT